MSAPVTYHVRMKDGVRLATDVYLPAAGGPHPVIILRTPYGRGQMKELAEAFTARGYGFLAQDLRGTGDSEGQLGPYAQEPPDALATARWLLRQEWCDGRLGILGISYCSGASIAIAAAMPEHVRACVWVTVPVCRELLSFQGGALRLHHAAPWSILMREKPPLRQRDWNAFYRTLPLPAMVPDSPIWQILTAEGEEADRFWSAMDLSHYLDAVRVPGLHAGGWYDFLLDATLEPFRRMRSASNAPQRLLIGPWSHNAIIGAPEFQEAAFAWFDHWFKGTPDRIAPATVFLTGEGAGAGWRRLDGWPDPSASDQPLYLAPGRRLLPEPPDEGEESFVSDPHNPVPTQGGAVWEFPQAGMGLEPGPAVQTTGQRTDVLTYETEPATSPVAICGEVHLELRASSSTPDADFAAKLCDVAPDGTARYICDGIVRGRFRGGWTVRSCWSRVGSTGSTSGWRAVISWPPDTGCGWKWRGPTSPSSTGTCTPAAPS